MLLINNQHQRLNPFFIPHLEEEDISKFLAERERWMERLPRAAFPLLCRFLRQRRFSPSTSLVCLHARVALAAGKVPGIVYSSADATLDGGAPVGNESRFLVRADKIVLDREIRRLSTSFDNTVRRQPAANLVEDDAVIVARGVCRGRRSIDVAAAAEYMQRHQTDG